MRKLSDAFKRKQNEGTAKFLKYADFTLKDGTELHLSNEELWDNGFKFEDAVSSESSFDIGAAITNQCTISLNNIYDDFTDYVFEGAEVVCYVGLKLYPEGAKEDTIEQEWKDVDGNAILDVDGNKILLSRDDSVIERVRICTMTVTDAPYQNSSVINLVCQDNMRKFDKSYSDSKLQYPATRSEIIRDACNVCGVVLNTTTFENDDYVIKERPIDEGLTFRQVIAWTVQCGCQWLRCNEDGQLCIGWYNTEPKAEERGSVVNTNGLTVNMEDVVITGIRVTENVETSDDKKIKSYLCGEEGYVLEITGNKLICAGSGNEIATLIGERCIGMKFRPFTVKQLTDISLEAGDAVVVTDRKGNQYESYITNMNIQPGNYQLTECNAKSAERNSSKRYELLTQAMANARKNMNQKIARYDETVQQMTKLISQGFGMYFTEVKQENGGSIFYMHNKPNMEESGYVCYWTSNGIIASLDGGTTWAIDKNGNALFNVITARGINANWINTGEFRVTDEDGNEVFYVNCDTGVVRIKAQQFSLTGESIAEIANKQIDNFVENIYKTDLDEIKQQLSNKIETWYQDSDPSVNWGGTVEMAWCDVNGESILDVNGNEIILLYEESKAEHEGDLWKDLSTNDEYIYRGGQWVKMQVLDEVFDEIDGKAQIFINTPVPPYRVGDLWFDSDTQELLTCVESRDKGSCVKSDWQKKTKYTDDSGLNTFISAVYDPKIAELQSQIDGQIETWFYDHEPSLQNEPAVNWTTNEQRKEHEGDLFFWKSTGYSYRFLQDGATWKWQIVQDTDISKALVAAEKAQDTADHKRRVFVVTPQPPYDIGDLWVQGETGDIMRCRVSKSDSSEYATDDWEKASKYTDDTRANEVQKELETVNKDLQNQIDGKIETYNQATDPSASWITAELKTKHTGDLWYNSKTEETMRWNGSAWSKLSDADAKAAKNLAVTKKRVFSVTPYPPYDKDDLWVQGTSGDLMRCVTSRQSGEYVTSDWVKATKYTDDSTINNFVKNTYATDLENIKNQIDQKIETWFQATDPSLAWTGKETFALCDINGNEILDINGNTIMTTSETEKLVHEGDLWKNSQTGDEYIYRSGNWKEMPVPDSVFDEIDGKASIYVTQPKPPYNVGDAWFTGTDILTCVVDRDSGEFVASDWQKKNNYTDDSALNNFLTGDYSETIKEIKTQVDGKAETWRQDIDPATAWTTAELKAQHKGDLWYKTSEQKSYIYNGTGWTELKSNPPDEVFDAIDGKAQIFSSQPKPPYSVNDLYLTGTDILVCKTTRESGSYVASDWRKRDNYTDDSALKKFMEGEYSETIQGIKTQIDGKLESFFRDYEPTLENYPANTWTTEEERLKHNADTFYWSSKKATYIFCKIDGVWQWLEDKDPDIKRAMEAAAAAQDTANGKRRTFVTTPIPPYDVGDLWIQGDKGDLMCCVVAKESGKYQSSDWGKATKYTDDSALNKFSKELNQSEIFNRLTNNGTEQGIFLRDGKIFINFSYAEGGTLKLGGKNNLYGELIMVDAEGKEVGRWNNGELSTSSAKILGGTINIDTGELNNAIKLNARNNSLSLSPIKMVIKTDPINSGEYGYGNYSEIASNTIKMGRISNGSGNSAISNYTALSPDGIKINDYKKGGHIYLEPISLGGYFDCDLTVTKNFSAQGTKNRIVNTENYASRLQYCYEMPSPMFGDIGEGYTDDTGVCIVAIDDIFRETVTSGSNYYVFLQKEGPGDIWIENKTDSYFTVQGTKNMKFSWEIKAKQKEYEFERLECYKELENDEEYINYEDVGYYTYTKYVNDLELGGEEV